MRTSPEQPPPRRVVGGAARLGAVVAAACAIAACASAPPPRQHSLQPPPAEAAGAPRITAAGKIAWELAQVKLAPGFDQPQWVVRAADGSLIVLEQERWIAPLAEEIHAALALGLTQRLGPSAADTPWRIAVDVQRFDTVPGQEARVAAVWAIEQAGAAGKGRTLRCRSEFVQRPSGEGYLALAAAHREAQARLAEAIAAGVEAVARGAPESCGGG